jgi:hypothetical protein
MYFDFEGWIIEVVDFINLYILPLSTFQLLFLTFVNDHYEKDLIHFSGFALLILNE